MDSPIIAFGKLDEMMQQASIRQAKQLLQKQKDDLIDRYKMKSLLEVYLRMSSMRKVKFLQDLLKCLGDVENLFVVLDPFSHIKTITYQLVQPDTNFAYEKYIVDHDRSLDENVLENYLKAAEEWIVQLPPDKKASIMIDLLKLKGGIAINMFVVPTMKQFNKDGTAIREATAKEFLKPVVSVHEEMSEENYDISAPESAEVSRLRQKWNDAITRYRFEVHNDVATLWHRIKQPDLDKLQFLPVWILKKIFNYLTPAEKQNAKKMNAYWYYVITDQQKDVKVREQLDMKIAKLRQEIDRSKLERVKLLRKPPKIKPKEPACIKKNLTRHCSKQKITWSLLTECLNTINENLVAGYGSLDNFPRFAYKNSSKFYKYETSPLQDVNIDIERESQIFEYELSSSTVLSEFNMEMESLRDVMSTW